MTTDDQLLSDWNTRWSAFETARLLAGKALNLWDAAAQYSQRVTGTTLESTHADLLRSTVYTNVNLNDSAASLVALESLGSQTAALMDLATEQWTKFSVAPHFLWTGILDAYFETGTEGVLWSLEEVPFKGYEGLQVLKDGDELTVYRSDGSIRWQGVVDLEYETGYVPYPRNPQYGQQYVFGLWVHGNQRGMNPEDWASMFLGLPENFNRELGELTSVREPLQAQVVRYLNFN